MEQGEFVPVRRTVVGTERRAVAALVAQPVYVKNLGPSVGQGNRYVCPVGTYVRAGLADYLTAETAVSLPLGRFAEYALFGKSLDRKSVV